ncbi:MAG: PGF-pre-PGF domain-containing protein [Euryarchaeota archaeon]|nr:PGF-pre-PGF domain-containing protein [Euryarchaeota archaeon]
MAYSKSLSSSTPGQKEVPVLEHDNILKAETKVNDIVAYKPVEYSFISPELSIYQIVVTGKENQYDVPIKVEALKWSPEGLPKPAPGKVYRNLNIIANTKNVKEASISFKVENSWIESSDLGYDEIKMFRWTGEEWSKLNTNQKTKDATYSYYEARTYGFSHFAISGQKTEPVPTAVKQSSSVNSKEQDSTWLWLPIIIVLLAVGAYKSRRRLKNISLPKIIIPRFSFPWIIIPAATNQLQPNNPDAKDINISSAFGYKGATILYKVKIENISSAPFADIKVTLFVPNVFLLVEKEKSIALLKVKEGKTVTFEIRPTGECGNCEVSGKINYYDTASNRTKEIDMPAETLFTMVSRIIKDMHMHLLTPEVTQSEQLFDGVARFYGEGVKGL